MKLIPLKLLLALQLFSILENTTFASILVQEDYSSSVTTKRSSEKLIWGIEQKQLEDLFNLPSDKICLLVDDQFFYRINTNYIKTFGWSETDLVSRPFKGHLHPDDQQSSGTMADQIAKDSLIHSQTLTNVNQKIQVVINFENRHLTRSGDYRSLQWLLLLQVSGPKTQPPILCIGQDVTLKKQDEVQRQKLEQAQLATRMKSTFVAHMSHELRTPLNGVIGFLDLALEEEMSDTLKYHLGHARESAGLLLDIANNIVDVSRLEAGRLNLQQEIFRPIDSLKSVVDSLKEPADHKNITLKLSTSDTMPLLVQGDAHRFQQILFNLGSNAVKFTQHGKVSIKLDSHPVIDKPQQIMIRGRVKDTGIGINPQFIPKLFQPFSQEDQSMKRDVGGTGLGLYLTKELCEKMNGSIYVLSTPGLGSTFEFKVMMNSMDVDL